VTVDPERDTQAVMKDYLSSFDPHLRGATGDRASIDAVEKAFRVYAKKVPADNGEYSMDHTALVYLMDKQGRFVAPFNLKRRPEEAAADLKRYLSSWIYASSPRRFKSPRRRSSSSEERALLLSREVLWSLKTWLPLLFGLLSKQTATPS